MLFAACKPTTNSGEQETVEADTLGISAAGDSTIWGCMGEGTGMSAFEFITENGDTMEIYRTNPTNGIDGHLMGQIRNATDQFAITLQNDGESMLTAINATQLAATWRCERGEMTIHSGGTISSDSLEFNGWRLWNGHLLLGRSHQTEYGQMNRVDTMDIVLLSSRELIIRNEYGEETRFTPVF